MAMPPGGQSSWFHHADAYQLYDERDQLWAMLNVPLAAAGVTFGIRTTHSASDWFHLFRIDVESGHARWTFIHPRLPDGQRSLLWTADSPPHELVPHPDVLPRGQFGRLVEDALPLATLEARPSEIALVDARGATRLVVRLGEVSDWPDGERGVIASGGTTVASFWLPTGEGARVSKVAVSLP